MRQTMPTPLHLTAEDSKTIGPADFGAPGLVAVESVGPERRVRAIGPLLAIHDSTFEPRCGIGHHPHQGMERLFYILSGAVDHDDRRNGITGHMGAGDLGILTEGRAGMLHSESNPTDEVARCYILVYPCEPMVPSAGFDVIRGSEMPRHEGPGWVSTEVVGRDQTRLHGDVRSWADTTLRPGGAWERDLPAGEAAVLFVLDGTVSATVDDGEPATVGTEETLLLPPSPAARQVHLASQASARLLWIVTGPGFGLELAGD